MSDNWIPGRCGRGATLADSSDGGRKKGSKLVVVCGRGFAPELADDLRGLGWEVCMVTDGPEARRLALRKRSQAVLLPAEGGYESGYLTCAKLRAADPGVRVVIVGPRRTPQAERFAQFVGAAFVAESDGPAEVLKAVTGEN
jgi:CheY-like chemotaxis protein